MYTQLVSYIGLAIQVGSMLLQNLLGFIDKSFHPESCVTCRELIEQLSSPLAFFTLHVKLLHAHDQPPCLVYADAPVLHDKALTKNQVVAVR